MKIFFQYALPLLAFVALYSPIDLAARGGGGHGGGGGRGGGYARGGGGGGAHYRGGASRSPSMSRGGYRGEGRSFAGENRNWQGQGHASREQVQRFFGENRPNINREHKGQWANRNELNQHANTMRNDIANRHPGAQNWFNHDFWRQHNYNPSYYANWGNRWRPANWAAAAGWLALGAAVPLSYEYGSSYPVDYSTSYSTTPTEYTSTSSYQPAVSDFSTSSTSTAATSQDANWLPLGIYALTKADIQATPNMYIQLALNKSGEIAGTYYNSTTDAAYPLEGSVDKSTQRVAFKVSNSENSPIIETGLYNLTQNEAPVSLHFADGDTQNWVLVPMQGKSNT